MAAKLITAGVFVAGTLCGVLSRHFVPRLFNGGSGKKAKKTSKKDADK